MSIKYIQYSGMKPFYTIDEVCELFGISKSDLRRKCEQYKVKPVRSEIGEPGFSCYDVRRLHNKLYYEDRNRDDMWDPWES